MDNPFNKTWRSKCNISDIGLGIMIQYTHKGVVYTLQNDGQWSSCPIGMTFKSKEEALKILVNVDPPKD